MEAFSSLICSSVPPFVIPKSPTWSEALSMVIPVMLLPPPSKLPWNAASFVPIGVHSLPSKSIFPVNLTIFPAKVSPPLTNLARPASSAAVSISKFFSPESYQLVSASFNQLSALSSAAKTAVGIIPISRHSANRLGNNLFSSLFLLLFCKLLVQNEHKKAPLQHTPSRRKSAFIAKIISLDSRKERETTRLPACLLSVYCSISWPVNLSNAILLRLF